MHLILNRSGRIVIDLPTKTQCKVFGHTTYDYQLRLKCLPRLDSKGFLIDHEQLHEAVQCAFYRGVTSCETVLIRIAEHIEWVCRVHGTKLVSLNVKLIPTDSVAHMELEKNYD